MVRANEANLMPLVREPKDNPRASFHLWKVVLSSSKHEPANKSDFQERGKNKFMLNFLLPSCLHLG